MKSLHRKLANILAGRGRLHHRRRQGRRCGEGRDGGPPAARRRGDLSPLEAVRAYHAALGKKGIVPDRSPEADAIITESALKLGEQGAR